MKLALILAVVVLLAGAAWLFRYAYLAPVIYQDTPTAENPTGRSVVVCKANRWTAYVTCETVISDIDETVRQMEKWMKDRAKK